MARNLLALILLLAPVAVAQVPADTPHFVADKVKEANHPYAGPLSPGMLVSIYGSALGPVKPCQAHPDPELRETPHPDVPFPNLWVYPQELCGVRVLVDGVPAGMLYAQANQINFKMPMTVAIEGTVGIEVIHSTRRSRAVDVPVAIQKMHLAVPETNYTDLPIWIDIDMPTDWPTTFHYPMGFGPGYIRCHHLELRKGGRLLEALPGSRARNGVGSGPICGSGGFQQAPENRLPLHVFYRLDEPGEYEVRFNLKHYRSPYGDARSETAGPSTGWIPFQVMQSPENQRSEWIIDAIANVPTDHVEAVSRYLPDLLGVPDAESLDAVLDQLYNPHHFVRRYAELALNYWPQDTELEQTVQRKFAQRGPSNGIVRWLAHRRRIHGFDVAILEPALPYLRSKDPVLLEGALISVAGYGATAELKERPELGAIITEALLDAADLAGMIEDDQARNTFIQSLRNTGDERAVAILWSWVDQEPTLGPLLSSIASFARPADLPRLAAYTVATEKTDDYYATVGYIPEALREAFGEASIPYLVRTLRDTPSDRVRLYCAVALLPDDHPDAWAVVVTEIESRSHHVRSLVASATDAYPELAHDESLVLKFAREHAVPR